jgi:hypothetical protein
MDWRSDSSGKAPPLQVQSPEFKSQTLPEKQQKKGKAKRIKVHMEV